MLASNARVECSLNVPKSRAPLTLCLKIVLNLFTLSAEITFLLTLGLILILQSCVLACWVFFDDFIVIFMILKYKIYMVAYPALIRRPFYYVYTPLSDGDLRF